MKAFALSLMFLILPASALAHASGYSLEAAEGGHTFDVGYSDLFSSGQQIRFDLALWNADKTKPEAFDGTWVRLYKDKQTYFAGPIGGHDFGNPGFTFIFPEQGEYSLSVRYFKADSTNVEHTFSLVIPKGESQSSFPVQGAVGFVLGAAMAAGGVWFIYRKR